MTIETADKMQRLEQRIEELKASLQKNAECGNTHYNLGVAYLGKREFRDAEAHFREAITHSPKMVEAYVQLGGIAMQRGDLEGCLNFNYQATELRPMFATPWGNIGFVLLQQGEFGKAAKVLEKAVKIDPEFIQAIANLGSAYLGEGDLERCIATSLKAVEKEPMFGPAYNNLALAYLESGDKEKAIEYFDKAVSTGFEPHPAFAQEIEGLRG